ncbi:MULTISPECIES: glycosyltransferase [Acinetobacter]|jgi:alpha-1,3-rhamnosyltransferase|uniref:glycosyltransferase n=1 Tax=Acinetobacter TaxID=469 RepID=UPI001F60AFD4|nr:MULTISPECIES: glycosyltransferase [Acinetobacter]MEB5928168.1 glycosyltransferase [Acinetobacter schindleri]UNT59744.1 glycosyltransferase [Acinetobacter sp. ASP199]
MNTSLPLVTVVIPSYNHSKYIQQSIQSVIDQTYARIELIVIDDGSQDDSVARIEVMRQLCEKRFERFLFITRENRGLSKTLNQGIALANGEFFSTVASDDIMLPEKTTIQIEAITKNTNIAAIFGAHQLINDDGDVVKVKENARYREFTFQEIFFHQHDIPASSQLIDLKLLKEIGGYNENTKVEDWDLWLRLTEHDAKLIYLPEIIVGYRMHETNLSRDKSLMFEEVFKILQQYKDKKGYPYAEYKVYKFYKIRPAKEKSYINYLLLRIKYSISYLIKSICEKK